MLNLLTDEHFRQLIAQKKHAEIIAHLNREGIISDILGGKKVEIVKKIEASGEKIRAFLETQALDNSGSLHENTYLLAEGPSTRSLAVGPVAVAAAALYLAVVTIGAVELVGAVQFATVTTTFTSVSGGDGDSYKQCHSSYEQKNYSVIIKLSKSIDPYILFAYKKSETESAIGIVLETVEKIIGYHLNDRDRILISDMTIKHLI